MLPFDPLKTSENPWFSVFRGSKGNIGKKWVKAKQIQKYIRNASKEMLIIANNELF